MVWGAEKKHKGKEIDVGTLRAPCIAPCTLCVWLSLGKETKAKEETWLIRVGTRTTKTNKQNELCIVPGKEMDLRTKQHEWACGS